MYRQLNSCVIALAVALTTQALSASALADQPDYATALLNSPQPTTSISISNPPTLDNDQASPTNRLSQVSLPTSAGLPAISDADNPIPSLDRFISALNRSQPGLVVGAYIPHSAALRVIQQPSNDPGYVSAIFGTVTLFSLAAQRDTIGLLAHNYLSGSLFFTMNLGQEVDIIYGDGALRRFSISAIRHFQALNPNSPYSDFIDLENGNAQLTSTDLFNLIYTGGNKIVFQTCIQANGDMSWGRLFVIATPIQ